MTTIVTSRTRIAITISISIAVKPRALNVWLEFWEVGVDLDGLLKRAARLLPVLLLEVSVAELVVVLGVALVARDGARERLRGVAPLALLHVHEREVVERLVVLGVFVRGPLELVSRVGEPPAAEEVHPLVVVIDGFTVVLTARRDHGDRDEEPRQSSRSASCTLASVHVSGG